MTTHPGANAGRLQMDAPTGALGRDTLAAPGPVSADASTGGLQTAPVSQVQTGAAASQPAQAASVELSGWLWSKGGQKEGGSKKESWRKGKRRNWKKRWFSQTGRLLCYHETSEDAVRRRPPVGRIDLALFQLREREPTVERQVRSLMSFG